MQSIKTVNSLGDLEKEMFDSFFRYFIEREKDRDLHSVEVPGHQHRSWKIFRYQYVLRIFKMKLKVIFVLELA